MVPGSQPGALCDIVVKIGGSTLGSGDTSLDDVASLHRDGRRIVVVHGGGATITEWLARQQIEARFERGLRVTDDVSLDVVIAVLAGLVNKQLVAGLLARRVPATGISGVDGGTLRAAISDPSLGRVGEVRGVDTGLVEALLMANMVPVLAPLAAEYADGTATGGILNVNADEAAGHIAAAVGAAQLVFLTDVPGVLRNRELLPRVAAREVAGLIEAGVIAGGMIPKARAAVLARAAGVPTRIVDGREPGALARALADPRFGSTIE